MTQLGLHDNTDVPEEKKTIEEPVEEEPVLEPEVEPSMEEEAEAPRAAEAAQAPPTVVFVDERLHVVPFRQLVYVPVKRRAKKAVSILRAYASRHMKSEYVLISPKVNDEIWARGISKPPNKIKVRLAKDTEGIVHVLPVAE